jgi:hypothetical protein
MRPLMVQIELSMHITQHHLFKESTLTCPQSSQVPLHTKLGQAEELLELPLELNRSGPRAIRLLLDQHLRVVCTTWLAILELLMRRRLRKITIRPVIPMLQ